LDAIYHGKSLLFLLLEQRVVLGLITAATILPRFSTITDSLP